MTYYCTIEKERDEYIAQFPDMTNIVTCGFTHEEALAMAKEALDGCLEADISQGNAIPPPVYGEGYPVPVASHIALALRLRELRGEQSQTDIARKLGLSYQAYQRLENPRKANPTIKTLERIAHVYGRELNISILRPSGGEAAEGQA
jgi:antitoxin HicB